MSGVQSIERAFAILRTLLAGPLGVTEIAARTALPKSTASRLLSAMEAEAVVHQAESGSEYELGPALHELADAARPDASMVAVVRPVLRELRDGIGESAGFTVRVRRDVYWVDNVDQEANVQIQDKTGHLARLHSVASGMALLAHLPDDELEWYLAEPLEQLNERTPTDADELRLRLAEIRTRGVYWSIEELEEGLSSIAVPFRGPSGAYEAALYVEGPSFRFPAAGDTTRVERLMVAAAEELSDRFARR